MSDTGAPLSLDALFGAMLRAYRRGGLRETAAKIPINFSHLAKWERGERPVPAELVPALDRAYAANGALITLHELIARDRTRAHHGPNTCPGPGTPEAHRRAQRRLLAMSTPAAPETAAWAPLLGALDDLADGVHTAITHRDGITPQRWERLAWEHTLAYRTSAPGTLLPPLIIGYGRLSALLGGQTMPAPVQSALLGVAAHLAVLLAREYADIGHLAAADHCWELARDAADSSGERDLRAWVRVQQAGYACWTARPVAVSARLIDEALSLTGDAPGVGAALAYAARAHLLAGQGQIEGAHAALEAFCAMASALPAQGADEAALLPGELPPWARAFHLVYPYVAIGDLDRASCALSEAERLCPPDFCGAKATLGLFRAHLLIAEGAIEDGLTLALPAARDWPLSTPRRHLLTRLLAALPPEVQALPLAHTLHCLIVRS